MGVANDLSPNKKSCTPFFPPTRRNKNAAQFEKRYTFGTRPNISFKNAQ